MENGTRSVTLMVNTYFPVHDDTVVQIAPKSHPTLQLHIHKVVIGSLSIGSTKALSSSVGGKRVYFTLTLVLANLGEMSIFEMLSTA